MRKRKLSKNTFMKLFPLSQASMNLKKQLQKNLIQILKKNNKMKKSNNSCKLSWQMKKHQMIQTAKMTMRMKSNLLKRILQLKRNLFIRFSLKKRRFRLQKRHKKEIYLKMYWV
jgi:hypothetical protein